MQYSNFIFDFIIIKSVLIFVSRIAAGTFLITNCLYNQSYNFLTFNVIVKSVQKKCT